MADPRSCQGGSSSLHVNWQREESDEYCFVTDSPQFSHAIDNLKCGLFVSKQSGVEEKARLYRVGLYRVGMYSATLLDAARRRHGLERT